MHAIGSGFSGVFGQLPAIFALDGTQHALQVRQSARRRGSGRAKRGAIRACNWVSNCAQCTTLGRSRLGSGQGGMLGGLHELLLSLEVSESWYSHQQSATCESEVREVFFRGSEEDYCSAYKVQL